MAMNGLSFLLDRREHSNSIPSYEYQDIRGRYHTYNHWGFYNHDTRPAWDYNRRDTYRPREVEPTTGLYRDDPLLEEAEDRSPGRTATYGK